MIVAVNADVAVNTEQKPGGLAAAREREKGTGVPRRKVQETVRRPINRVSLEKAREKASQQDQVDFKPLEQVIESKESDRYTQSEAHMHLGEIRKLINDNYNIAPYLNVISTALANEAKYKDTHYAFYHSTPNVYRLTQDLFTQLYAAFHPEEKVEEHFKFLRFNNESVNQSAHGWLVNELKEKGLVDDNSDAGAILLSVNLAIFGNVGFSGECSWQYFIHPQGHKAPNRETYEEMMKNFGLTNKYVDEIMSLVDIYQTEEDTLIQILVPIDKVEQIGYLAWVKGIPAHQEVIDLIKQKAHGTTFNKTKPVMEKLTERFADEQKNNPLYVDMMKSVEAGDFSLAAFLKVYRNKPWDLLNINDVTGRLLFTPDVLLNPESGVKFYRFSTANRDKLKEYRSRLNEIVDKLLADKESAEAAAANATEVA